MSENERKFLEITDLKKGFGSGETRQEVLQGMNFSVSKGEICVLLGPSGSGKSTLLNIIGGIDSADSGYISINGDKLEELSEKALTNYRRKHLGYVFQMYIRWISMNFCIHWGCTNTAINFQTSYPAVSSKEYPLDVQLSKIRISCCATNRQERLITTHPKKF